MNKLKIVLISMCVVIVGLSGAVVYLFINSSESNGGTSNEENKVLDDIDMEVSEYINTPSSERNQEEYEEITKKIELIREQSDDQYIKVTASIQLSYMHYYNDGLEGAIAILDDELLKDDMSDENRYSLLTAKKFFYKDAGDNDGLINTIQDILLLPEDMTISYDDWSVTRSLYIEELEELTHEE